MLQNKVFKFKSLYYNQIGSDFPPHIDRESIENHVNQQLNKQSPPDLKELIRGSEAADAQRDEDPAPGVGTFRRVLTQLFTDLAVDFIPGTHTHTHTHTSTHTCTHTCTNTAHISLMLHNDNT